ncbi:MAG: hypothetical protein AB1941_20600 [Gemmatimonadota bacterium]
MRTLLLLVAVATAAAHPVAAQDGRPARVPVTVALAEGSTLGDAPFRVLRRADTSPHDVILLAPDADAAALSEAVGQLLTIRRVQGNVPAVTGAMRVRRPGSGRGPRMLPWAPRVLQDLRRADTRPLAGVGTVRSVQVWLPPTSRGRSGT